MPDPLRGDIWLIDLNPVRGHESAGRRPGLVLSVDLFNRGPAGLVVVLPVTSRRKGIPLHVTVSPPEGGLDRTSYIKCEDIRPVSKDRLLDQWGKVTAETLRVVEDRVRILLGL